MVKGMNENPANLNQAMAFGRHRDGNQENAQPEIEDTRQQAFKRENPAECERPKHAQDSSHGET